VAFDPQRQRLQPLDEEPGVERRQGRADVAQQLHPQLDDEGQRPEGLGVADAVVRRIGLDEVREARARRPVERAAVDHHSADAGAVAADPLGGRVDDDIGTVLDRLGDDRREGVVDEERQVLRVRGIGDGANVGHVEARVADRLEVVGLRVLIGRGGEVTRIVALDPAHLDPEARQRVGEQVVRAAVEARRADDVVAGARQVEDGQRLRRLPRRQPERADAALERRHALLEDVGRGVHDPGVDVSELLEREEPGGVIGVLEVVGAGGVDRDGARAGGRIGLLSGVEGQRLGEEGALGSVAVAVGVAHRYDCPSRDDHGD
jgi:hypothetical protein